MRIVALVAAFNEADVIGQVLDELLEQRIEVHLLDDGSTDGTATIAAERLGRGVLAVERFDVPGEAGDRYRWAKILERKQELAREIESDWYLHQDADELRESPWLHRNLREGLELVDALGFNAVDFEVFNFRPVDDSFAPGADLRQAFELFERAESWDRVQIKAWRRQPEIDLASTGGHEAVFPERKVFPIRFLSRHYPIRSRAHGERKVFVERRPRFLAEEIERGWHRQYEDLARTRRFVWSPEELERFDAERVRIELALKNREWEAAAATPVARDAELLAAIRERDRLGRGLDRQNREVDRLGRELDLAQSELERLRAELDLSLRESQRLGVELDERNRDAARLAPALDGANREAARLALDLDRQNREVERLGADLDRQNREVERLGLDLDRRNREVERLGSDLDLRNRAAERLGLDLDRQNRELARLGAELDSAEIERERLGAKLEDAGKEAERRVGEARAAVAAMELSLSEAGAKVTVLEAELERLRASRSWRWTAPLRRMAAKLPIPS